MLLRTTFYILLHTSFAATQNSTTSPKNVTKEDERGYFEKALESRAFIDKSLLIEELLIEPNKFLAITCPRRFGKSTNLDMVKQFFEMPFNHTNGQRLDKKTTKNYHLFTNKTINLKITTEKAFFDEHFGKYPVLHLNFAPFQAQDMDQILHWLKTQIIFLFEPYEWLYKVMSDEYQVVEPGEKEKQDFELFGKVLDGNFDIDLSEALHVLQQYIYEYYGTELMVFIDEYDTLVKFTINWNKNIESIVKFLDSLLYSFTRTPSYVKLLVISGVSYTYRAANSSQVRNIHHYGFLDDHRFAKYYGFTQQEVDILYHKNGIDIKERKDEMKPLCDGYQIRTQNISLYSPLDWEEYFKRQDVVNSWVKTGGWNALSDFLDYELVLRSVLSLLSVGRINFQLLINATIKDLEEFANTLDYEKRRKAFTTPSFVNLYLTELFESGYLCYTENENIYKIPNKGVENVLREDFELYFDNSYGLNIANSTVADRFTLIVHRINTTSAMTSRLTEALQDTLKLNYIDIRNSFQLRAIIFTLVYFTRKASREIVVSRIDDNSDTKGIGPGRSDLILISGEERILLIVEIRFDGNVTEAVQEAVQYIPIEPRRFTTLKVIKYLGINMNGDKSVQVEAGENRYDW